jgi:transposase
MKPPTFVPAPLLVGVELNPGPRKSGPISKEKRNRIICLKDDAEFSNYQIADKLDVSPKAVRSVIRRYRKMGQTSNRPGQGRKRKLSREEERSIMQKADREKSAETIATQISKKRKKSISEHTVRRVLKRRRHKYLTKIEREDLTEVQMERRLAFAEKRINDNWRKVLFSDEKTFELQTGPHKCWENPAKRKVRRVKRWPKKIHVWGGIGYWWQTKLYFFEQNLDGELYRKILNKCLPPAYTPKCPARLRDAWVLVQDNDPKHTAGATRDLLDEIAPDRISDWPSKSPDFNVIEDVWSQMKTAIEETNITTIRGLKRKLTQIWNEFPIEKVRSSINSMQRRLQQCIDRQGDRTDY